MSALRIRRCDHVGFSVTSLDAAVRFWTDVLGGTLLRSLTLDGPFLGAVTGAHGASARVALVDLAGQVIELLEYASAPPRHGPAAAPFDPGALHLAFVVDDLDAILDRIGSHGWLPQGRPQAIARGPRAGTRVIYVVGPDGEALELMEPPAGLSDPASPADRR